MINIKSKIVRTIIDDGGHEFKIGDKVRFVLHTVEENCTCEGVICNIEDDLFKVNKTIVDGRKMMLILIVRFTDIKDGKITLIE